MDFDYAFQQTGELGPLFEAYLINPTGSYGMTCTDKTGIGNLGTCTVTLDS